MAEEKFEEMSLIGHLAELRKRLLWSFLYILLIFIVCFYFADELFAFLFRPCGFFSLVIKIFFMYS